MSRPLRALLLCGGPSAEHEVSLASARSLLAATAERIEWEVCVIDRRGGWWGAEESAALLRKETPARSAPADVDLATLRRHEVVFPLLHGPYGEDGRIQGALEVLGVKYVGAGVLASAVGMDKVMMKGAFAAAGLPQVAYRALSAQEWRRERGASEARLDELGYPLFVKPANLGSSIGISPASDVAARTRAIDHAFEHDRRVIVEAGQVGVRELEVALLGDHEPDASVVGEIVTDAPFYDYRAKYTPGGARLAVPAEIPPEISEACQELARRAFRAIDATGLARVDLFWLPQEGRLLVNEINTMPGFTETSMFPRLWAASGLSYPELALKLLALAQRR
jgi:D-alanine-D-alanine ligase